MGAFAVNSGLFPHPPEQQNYVDQYAKLAQLRNALAMAPLQRQEAQQQIQAGQLDIQQKQQALNDQQAATKAMQEWDGQNFMELPGLVLKHGGSAQSVLSMKSGILQQQEAMTKLSTDQLSNEKTKNDYIAGHIANVQALPPEQQADGFQSAVQDLVSKKYISPEQAQGLKYQGPQQLDYLKKTYQGLTAMQEEALKKGQTTEAVGKGEQAEAEAKKTQTENEYMQKYGYMTQAMADAKYRAIQQAKTLGQSVAPEDAAFTKAYEKQKTLVPVANFNLQNAGATGGGGGQPSAIAKSIADGSMKWQDVVSARTPMSVKQSLLAEVKQINPNFNSGDFDVEKKVKEAFTSGTYSQNLNAINTAREHMQTFRQLAEALDNSDVQAINKIGNALGVQFGSDKATNLRIASQAFGGEVGRAFDGAGVIGKEREEASKSFADYLSKGQFKGAIDTVDKLLEGKQKSLKQTFQQGVQAKPNFGESNQGGGQSGDPFAQFGGKTR